MSSDFETYEKDIDSLIDRFRNKLNTVRQHREGKRKVEEDINNLDTEDNLFRRESQPEDKINLSIREREERFNRIVKREDFEKEDDSGEYKQEEPCNIKEYKLKQDFGGKRDIDLKFEDLRREEKEIEEYRPTVEESRRIEGNQEIFKEKPEFTQPLNNSIQEERISSLTCELEESRLKCIQAERERETVLAELGILKNELKQAKSRAEQAEMDKTRAERQMQEMQRIHSEILEKKIAQIDHYTNKTKPNTAAYKNEYIVKCVSTFFKDNFQAEVTEHSIPDLLQSILVKLQPKPESDEKNVDWKLLAQRYIKTIQQQKEELAKYTRETIERRKKKTKKVEKKCPRHKSKEPLKENQSKMDSIKNRLTNLESKMRTESANVRKLLD